VFVQVALRDQMRPPGRWMPSGAVLLDMEGGLVGMMWVAAETAHLAPTNGGWALLADTTQES
jgi:hypothetical protein